MAIYYRGTSMEQLNKELTEKGLLPYENGGKIWLNKEEWLAKYYARFLANGARRPGTPVVITVEVDEKDLKMSPMSGQPAYAVKNGFIPKEKILKSESLK